ncbi:MAG TPA: hypothetical protein VNT25_00915 [Allosphingosinicella sp.]|jgi:hypothetical protein|nr:hypothetical protein [Allosphingosinicella sp.]
MKDDNDYLEARAEKELGMAQQAEQPAAVRAHYKLAEGRVLSGCRAACKPNDSSAAPAAGAG